MKALTGNQQYLLNEGMKLYNRFGSLEFKHAVRILCESGNEKLVNLLEYSGDDWAFKSGLDGREPEWVEAWRYGSIPENGRSTNWATGEFESGISCVQIDRGNEHTTIYDTIYGVQGISKIKIAGWYIGLSGSDGEPLLHDAILL